MARTLGGAGTTRIGKQEHEERPAQLPGYRLKYLDGNCLAASDHRLKPLRITAAGPLPGKSLVVFDPQLGLAVDVFPCADGHAQERSLLEAVAATVAPGEVWVADRNFCVSGFLHAIDRRAAFFIIRQHGGLTTKPLEPMRRVGSSDTGEVHEQAVPILHEDGPHRGRVFPPRPGASKAPIAGATAPGEWSRA